MAADAVRGSETRAWFAKAVADLRTAEVSLKARPPISDTALFHCQQAVEKAMKGFLTWNDLPFTKTHDLHKLAEQCFGLDASLGLLLPQTYPLTKYAVELRYPGESPRPAISEAKQALKLSRIVVNTILQRLPEAVMPRRR